MEVLFMVFFFFFQAEDGIRDRNVTGVQTCALPICRSRGSAEAHTAQEQPMVGTPALVPEPSTVMEIAGFIRYAALIRRWSSSALCRSPGYSGSAAR